MGDAYDFDFDFDCEGEPPQVYITGPSGSVVMKDLSGEPTCAHPSGWSWDPKDWRPPALAVRVCELLNEHGGPA